MIVDLFIILDILILRFIGNRSARQTWLAMGSIGRVISWPSFASHKTCALESRLSSSAKKRIKSNKPLQAMGRQGSDLVYQWEGKNKFLPTCSVWRATSDMDVDNEMGQPLRERALTRKHDNI